MSDLDVFCQDPAESLSKVRNLLKCYIISSTVLLNSYTLIGT